MRVQCTVRCVPRKEIIYVIGDKRWRVEYAREREQEGAKLVSETV